MRPGGTAPEIQERMDEHYRRMTPAEKAETVRDAWNTARTLALAGLRLDHPGESDEQLEARWTERRLGRALFGRALAHRRSAKR